MQDSSQTPALASEIFWKRIYRRAAVFGAFSGGVRRFNQDSIDVPALLLGALFGAALMLALAHLIRRVRWCSVGAFVGPLISISFLMDVSDYRADYAGYRLLAVAVFGSVMGVLACLAFVRLENWRRSR